MSYTPIAPVPGLTAKHEPLNSEECFAGKPQQSESLYYTSPSPSLPPSSRSQSIPPQHEVCGSSSLVQTLLHAHIMQAVNQKQLNDASVSIFRSTTDVENTSIPIPNSIDVSQSHSGEHAKLFPELWSEIFANCLSTPVGDDWPRGCSQYEKQLLTLAGVCSYWRQILLCAAVYWRWIQYAPSSRSGKDSDVDKITTWLSRSRKAPLHIALTFKHRPSLMSGRTSASPARVVDTIFATSHRWESLFISCQGFSPISLLAPVSGNLRALRKIEFDSVLSDMDNGDAVFGLFEGSQRLTSISALKGGHSSGLEVLKVLDGMTMALNHLTSVNLTPRIGSAQEFFAILELLPNVADLTVNIDAGSQVVRPRPLKAHQHEHLRSLSLEVELRGSDEIISLLQREVAEILALLVVPSLTRFSFACPISHWPKPEKALRDFVKRASGSGSGTLEELRIVEKEEVDGSRRRQTAANGCLDLQEYVKLVPGIRRLELVLREDRMLDVAEVLKDTPQATVNVSVSRTKKLAQRCYHR